MSANSPAEVHELFTRYFSAGNLEALLSLYEPEATMVPMGASPVSGPEGIRAALNGFLALKPQLDLTSKKIVQADDIALVLSSWTLKGTDANRQPIEMAGQTSDVVRRQPDGTWLFVIDIPHGAEVVDK